jgi:chorismate mutase/prephenate dehydratase
VSDPDKSIADWRAKIDAVDDRILKLLNERAKCVQEIGSLKESGGSSVYVASRELEIFERLEKDHEGPFPTNAIRNVFREIISASRSVEKGVRVAYLGPEATYTHQAALQQFGHMVDLVPATTPPRPALAERRHPRGACGLLPPAGAGTVSPVARG